MFRLNNKCSFNKLKNMNKMKNELAINTKNLVSVSNTFELNKLASLILDKIKKYENIYIYYNSIKVKIIYELF